jgi:polygalacturonase
VYSITTNGTYNLIVGQYGYTYHATSQVQYFKKSTNSLYDTLESVIYTNQFVASGSSGQIVTSSDGITWTSLSFSYGNNSTIRSLQSKLDDFVSVKDFGAKGDGVTDDTESINRAMYELYCRTNSIPARKTLYFPAGNYIVSGSINVPSHARIVGEGTFNTQITQTANPYIYPYVTWVMYIADNLQQIQNLIGLNGAGLPTDISISNLTINSLNDGIIVNNASRISLEQIRFKGPIASVTSLTDPINSVSTAAVRLLGYNLTVASDINLTHCLFDGFNHGVQVPESQTSSNALIDSCTFQNLFNGIYLNGTTAKGFTFTNSTMDAIYSSGIVAYNAVNFLSMGNYYRDVGNVLQGYTNPQSNVIFFDSTTAVGCASVADTFDRLTTASIDRINETINNISWDFQKYLRLGSFVQGNGKTVAVTASTTAVLGTSFDEYGSTTGLELLYTVWRNNAVRIGKIKFVLTSGGVYSIDDDYNQTGDVGIIIGYNGTDITYTSDSNGSGTIDYAIRYLEQL